MVTDEASAIHATTKAIDLHADTLMWARWVGYDLLSRHRPMLPRAAFAGHVDVPRLREGGIGAQYFGLVSLPVGAHGNFAVVDAQIDELDRACVRAENDGVAFEKCDSAEDVDRCNASGGIGALLGIEGAHALDGDLDHLDHFARRGVRYLGLMHFSANQAGFPAYGWGRKEGAGLTTWGKALIERCESAGVIVDLAHINREGWFDACAMAKRPLYCTHTGVLGVHRHWRNVDDDQLRAVAKTGGAVGVIFVPQFLGGAGLDAVVNHLQHMIDVGGEDLPALGSDWDGMVVPTPDLRDASRLPRLTSALLDAGIEERVIRKILRENALRVLREAAGRAQRATNPCDPPVTSGALG
ncbi:MAG: dipeptidase [Polyangiales bacterium]